MTTSRAAGLSRRKLLLASSALGITLLFPRRNSRAAPGARPRFLLHVVAPGGLDPTMMFDAPPLSMTASGQPHTPRGEAPRPGGGANGQRPLTASPTEPLRRLRDRFSIVNGVMMSTSFDGHDQNTNLFLTGNPFGGSSFNA